MAKKKIAAKKITRSKRHKGPRSQPGGPVKPSHYKVERGIAKPPVTRYGGTLTPERVALEALSVDHSFLIADKGRIKRTRDIITRMQKAGKKRFTMRGMPDGWRVWRLA